MDQSATKYCVKVDSEEYGPLPLDYLRTIGLAFTDLIRKEDETKYYPVSECKELYEYLYDASFYYKEEGNVYGPYAIGEILILVETDESQISIDSTSNWIAYGNVSCLKDIAKIINNANILPNVETTLNNSNDQITDLAKAIADLQGKVGDISNNAANVERDANAAQINELVNEINELKDKINKSNQSIENVSMLVKELDELKSRIQKSSSTENISTLIQEQNEEIKGIRNIVKGVQTQLEQLQDKEPPSSYEPAQAVTVININTYQSKYDDILAAYKESERVFKSDVSELNKCRLQELKYRKVYDKKDDEIADYVENHGRMIMQIEQLFSKIDLSYNNYKKSNNDVVEYWENLIRLSKTDSERDYELRKLKITEDYNKQINELNSSSLTNKSALRQVIDEKYNQDLIRLKISADKSSSEKVQKFRQEMSGLEDDYNASIALYKSACDVFNQINDYYSKYFDERYELALSSSSIWSDIRNKKIETSNIPPTTLLLGYNEHGINAINSPAVKERRFLNFLNTQNLLIWSDRQTSDEANAIVNTIIGREIVATEPGKVEVAVIDTENMIGTGGVLPRLNSGVFELLVKADEAKRSLNSVIDYIASVKRNVLLYPIDSIKTYNECKETKMPYKIIVFKNVGYEFSQYMTPIIKNGIEVGVSVILMLDKEQFNSDENKRQNEELLPLIKNFYEIDLTDKKVDGKPLSSFDTLSDDTLFNIVNNVNKAYENKQDEKVILEDYITPEDNWWKGRSEKAISIPFGVSQSGKVESLKFTMKLGQNSAVVIGIPGSGKSVFLHSIICNAIVNYSPKELCMYLIDFSGVEFNTYAIHNIPHAKVIAPEAEREFGISILKELVEEGIRREALCRKNNVNSVEELKTANPNIVVPRILVIIDEFQKFFEVENDSISREATSCIKTIIKEFRKYAINLVLATQKLPSSSLLDSGMIANRILFKSTESDFCNLLRAGGRVPNLRTGQCIYNSESGAEDASILVQGFFIDKNGKEKFLNRLTEYSKKNGCPDNNMMVFRANELPDFVNRRQIPQDLGIDNPSEVVVYFGESIAISETDVHAVLKMESGNNIVVVGGETAIAREIAFLAMLSTTTAYSDHAADYYTFDFTRDKESIVDNRNLTDMWPFDFTFAHTEAEVLEALKKVTQELTDRKANPDKQPKHIYLTFLSFELALMFDMIAKGWSGTPSECAKLMDTILKEGPKYGIFSIIQVDNVDNLVKRTDFSIKSFNYRIALQMTESDSNNILGNFYANRLFEYNRPSSKFRAYYYDNKRNITTKFKPYKIWHN